MITEDMIGKIVGNHAYDRDGEKIGKVGQVYVDDHDGSPLWATVNTGLFGMKETFVPLSKADMRNEDLRLAVTKAQVKDAPQIDNAEEHLDEAEQNRLDRYYAALHGGRDRQAADKGAADRRGSEREMAAGDMAKGERGMSDRDGAMTRSEERLRVGTEKEQTGVVRLRKYVVTEKQQVTVPVSHEEVRIEREPIREGQHRGTATIGEEQQEVTLHAERPVVDKQVEAVERVRLGTETVTEDRTVSGEVRKERIEVQDPKHQLRDGDKR